MKALSIKQPWVHAILHLGKDLENRTWKTKHRGWIALHASASIHKEAEYPGRLKIPGRESLDTSAICGMARIVEVVEKSRSKWFHVPEDGSTNYGWVLADVTILKEPIPCKGGLGLWKVPPAVVQKINKQLPGIDFKP